MTVSCCIVSPREDSSCGCDSADGLREGEDAGGFRLAQYGSLNSLSTRLNEVMLRIEM